MLLLSSDRLRYLNFAGESLSHNHLYAIYMGRGYTVVLEDKLRKEGLEIEVV